MGGQQVWTLNSLVGNKFGRLFVTSILEHEKKVICKCDCGKTVIVDQSNIARKNRGTKSCGCLAKELSSARAYKMISAGTKYSSPCESSARCVWQMHYSDGNLSFGNFYRLSQENCYYCAAAPQNKFNVARIGRASKHYCANGLFVYNGLDRINNDEKHNIDNVVPCCKHCNRAKSNLSVDTFYCWAKSVQLNQINPKQINPDLDKLYEIKSQSNHPKALPPVIASAKFIWKSYKKDGLKFDDFLFLSQCNCYYCGSNPSNKFNKYVTKNVASQNAINNGWFIYNGLDRIDSTLLHTIDNVVPCCKYCNFSKSNMSQKAFYNWINKITIRDNVIE